LGAAFALFLGSGALGYIFAQAYWAFVLACDIAIDLRQTIIGLNREFVLISGWSEELHEFRDLDDDEIGSQNKWVIVQLVSSYWASVPKDTGQIRDDDHPLPARLVDMLHGFGATVAGTVVSFVFWFILHFGVLTSAPHEISDTVIPIILWCVLCGVFLIVYNYTKRNYEVVTHSLFTRAIVYKYNQNKKPMQLFLNHIS